MSIIDKFCLVKLCPNLDGSSSLAPLRYQKMLWECLLGYKTALNFICTSVKFHNRHYTSLHTSYWASSKDFLLTLASDEKLSKIGYFSFSKSISVAKTDLDFSKNGFIIKIYVSRTPFVKILLKFVNSWKISFSKIMPKFGRLSITSSSKISKIHFRILIRI